MLLALADRLPGGGSSAAHIGLSPSAAPVMVWLAILLAGLFSSVTLALGTLARTSARARPTSTPLYFITIFPASIILFIPDFNPNLAYYLIPILNAVLVLRDAIVHDSVSWPALDGDHGSACSPTGSVCLVCRAPPLHPRNPA